MAWNIHWQINFKSFLGTEYNLNILDSEYSGSVISLIGGKSPFETQEDNGDDVFKPIRGQSGNISIVTNDPTLLTSIMPANNLARRVELRTADTDALVWRGFIPANAYTQPEVSSYFNVTIPVKSVLYSIANADFDGYYGKFLTIGDIIYQAFYKIGIIMGTDANMSFQTELQNVKAYMDTVVCASTFYSVRTIMNSDTTVSSIVADSCQSVLEAVLRPLGLAIFESAGNFYVVSNAKLFDASTVVNFQRWDFTMKQVTATDTYGKVSMSSLDSDIASDSNKISFTQGAKDVAVVFSIQDSSVVDSGEPDTPYSTNQINGGVKLRDGESDGVIYGQLINAPSTSRRTLWTEAFYQFYHSFSRRTATGQGSFSQHTGTEANTMSSSAFSMDTLTHKTDTPEQFGQAGYIGAVLCRTGEAASRTNLSLYPGLMVNMNSAYRMALYYGIEGSMPSGANDTVYTLRSNESYTFRSGYIHLDLEYKVIEYYERGYMDSGSVNVKVFIGNTEITPGITGITGYHVTSELTGNLWLAIYGGSDYPFSDPCTIVIRKLRLYWSIRADEVTASQDDSNVYMTMLNVGFTDSKEIHTRLGTDNNNKATVSILYDADMESVTSYQIFDNSPLHLYRPEKYLLALMEQQYGRPARSITRTYRMAWSVRPGLPFTDGTRNYMYVLDKVRWADDKVTVKFVQTYLTQ